MYRRGFTLIELLVVISIIGILAAIFLANMVGVRERSRDAATKNNLTQLQNALRLQYNDTQSYPASSDCQTIIGNLSSAGYMQNVQLDTAACSYTQITTDSYRIDATMRSTAGTAHQTSGQKCGVTGVVGHYYVCSN